MGEKFNYRCPECGFTAQCSHGRDRGFRLVVESLFCSECKTLKNIPVGEYVDSQLMEIKPVCWTCKSSETLTRWDGTTCPICKHLPMEYDKYSICFD